MTLYPDLKTLPKSGRRGETLWELTQDLRLRIGPRWYVQIKAGYVTNLGTIPRWLRWFVAPSDYPGPFLIHDFMCNEDHVDDGVDVCSGYSRWQADSTLYELLCRYRPEVPAYKRWLVWAAVRLSARMKGLR